MRALLDGYWWEDGPPSGRLVLRETVGQWAESFPADELFLAVPSRTAEAARASVPAGVRVVSTRLPMHPVINCVELPLIARRLGRVDAILAQNFSPAHRSSVVYVHDVLFQSNPEWFTRTERAYLSMIPGLARLAGSIVTSSESERRRVQAHNPSLRRIAISGLGVARTLLAVPPQKPEVALNRDRFVLAVGRINVRKNLQRTIDASLDTGLITPRYPLVIVGEPSGKKDRMPDSTRHAISNRQVIFTGRMSEGELRWLYENCDFFCCLSLGEGFGLPPLEARSFGAPVLVSDLEVFQETLGTGAEYVDPENQAAISASMTKLATRGRVRSRSEPASGTIGSEWSEVIRMLRAELQHVGRPVGGAVE